MEGTDHTQGEQGERGKDQRNAREEDGRPLAGRGRLAFGQAAFDGADKVIAKVDGSGEPWRFGLLPNELPDFLRERGLRLVSDLGADQYRERVMGQAGRHMQGYSFYHTALAEVGDA